MSRILGNFLTHPRNALSNFADPLQKYSKLRFATSPIKYAILSAQTLRFYQLCHFATHNTIESSCIIRSHPQYLFDAERLLRSNPITTLNTNPDFKVKADSKCYLPLEFLRIRLSD